MNLDQATRIAVVFARGAARSPHPGLCAACVELLDVSEAGITVMTSRQTGPMCSSGTDATALEDVQFELGDGPIIESFRNAQPVLAPSMDGWVTTQWPVFAAMANDIGIRSVFAFPMVSRGARVGVMSLYRGTAGGLSAEQHEDSLAVAEVLAETVLSLQDEAAIGELAAEIDDVVAYRAEIYQASGMVSVQLQVPAAEALSRIRAHAFVHALPVSVVAGEIVARRLRLDDDRAGTSEERGGEADVR